MDNTINRGLVRVIKTVKGGISIKLQQVDNPATERNFSFKHNEEFKPVPLDYIVSMFIIPGTLAAYNNGLFTFDEKDKERILKRATEVGFYYDNPYGGTDMADQPEVLFNERQMREIVMRNRTNEIQKVIDSRHRNQVEMLVDIVRENIDEINGKTRKIVEEAIGIRLEVDED